MAKLTIQDVAKVLTEKNGLPSRQANKFASEMFSLILERLQEGEPVKVKGLGTFKVIAVEARESVNVRTGERILIEGHDKVTFTPDTLMKELVNKPFSQFETVVLNDGVVFDDEQNDDVEEQIDEEEDNLPLEKRPLVNYVMDDEPLDEQETVPKQNVTLDEQLDVNKTNATEGKSIVEFIEEEINEPTTDGLPVVDYPIQRKSVAEEPIVEEPVIEETIVEQPAEEETSDVEEVKVDESPIVESAVKEPDNEPLLDDIDVDDDEPQHVWVKWLLAILGVLALMAASAYGGYLFAVKEMEPALEQLKLNEVKKDNKIVEQPVDTVKSVKDSVVVSKPMEASEPARQATPVETVKPMEVAKPNVTTKSNIVEKSTTDETPDPYAAKDERVRLGAYRIVGTLNVITVQPGQTFYSICRGNLGPDMECYVEVYNNFPRRPQVKVGQKIKIPKLELKKKRKR